MTTEDAQEVAAWHYEGLHGIHDWEENREMFADFLQWPDLYHAVRGADIDLIGYAQIARTWGETNTVQVILGLRPDLIGKGQGLAFVQACLAYARRLYAPQRFTLGVWAFNQQAWRVYEQAEFEVVRAFNATTCFGTLKFVEMVREEHG